MFIFPISLIKMSSLNFYTLDETSDRKIYNLLLSKMHKWNLRSKMYHVQPPIKSYSRQQSYILRENEFPSRFLKSCYRFLSCYPLTCRFNLVMINSGSISCAVFIFVISLIKKCEWLVSSIPSLHIHNKWY